MERDAYLYRAVPSVTHFNSHAHVERDLIAVFTQAMFFNFNSHAHVERDIKRLYCQPIVLNFNSHAHVERDEAHKTERQWALISTHTLTWSVTIETPEEMFETRDFNSHAHVERD